MLAVAKHLLRIRLKSISGGKKLRKAHLINANYLCSENLTSQFSHVNLNIITIEVFHAA